MNANTPKSAKITDAQITNDIWRPRYGLDYEPISGMGEGRMYIEAASTKQSHRATECRELEIETLKMTTSGETLHRNNTIYESVNRNCSCVKGSKWRR
jgi:hypothetical protein